MTILEKLNGKKHYLISSVCISKNGSMIWNYTDKASLTMKQMTSTELENIYQRYQMKIFMLIMFIKLREREEICF